MQLLSVLKRGFFVLLGALAVVMLGAAGSVAYAQDSTTVEVTGAGSSVVNGSYTCKMSFGKCESFSGHARYVKDSNSDVTIEWSDFASQWEIREGAATVGTTHYINNTNQFRPPEDGWQLPFGGTGDPPSLSYGSSGGTTVDSTSVAVIGAGASDVNGGFKKTGTENQRPAYQQRSDSDFVIRWTGGLDAKWVIGEPRGGQFVELYSQSNPPSGQTHPPEQGWSVESGQRPAPTLDYDAVLPTAEIDPATNVTSSSATLRATVNARGTSTTVEFEYFPSSGGGTIKTVSASPSPISDSSSTQVSADVQGLSPGTSYVYVVRASNSDGEVTARDFFVTEAAPPSVATDSAENVTTSEAKLFGTVSSGGASTTVEFEYYPTGQQGKAKTVTATQSPVTQNKPTVVTAPVTGLSPSKEYTFLVKGSNSAGSEEGGVRTFTTKAAAPTASTDSSANVTTTEAELFGTVSPGGASTTVEFEYYPTGEQVSAQTVTATQSPVTGRKAEVVSARIGELERNTSYTFYARASNRSGSDTGQRVRFSTAGPRLDVSQIQSPNTVTRFETITVSWTVENVGTGGTGTSQWKDQIWISPDADDDLASRGDVFLGSFPNQSALDVDDSYKNTKTLELPSEVNAMRGYVFVATNRGPAEFGPLYDVKSKELTIQEPPPVDLSISTFTSPRDVFSGTEVDLSWTVQNQSTNPTPEEASTWEDRVYLSDDDELSRDDSLLTTRDHEGIVRAGESYDQTASVRLPEATTGTRYFILETDADGVAYENNRTDNNVSSEKIEITLTPPPDLVVDGLNVRGSERSGDTTVVEWTVTNQGSGAAEEGWTDQVYRSRDATFDPNADKVVADVLRSASVSSKGSYTVDRTILLPHGKTGSFHYFVRTDAEDEVFEFKDEDNNLSASASQTISLAPPVDLAARSVSVQDETGGALDQANGGQRVQLKWTVKNTGQAATSIDIDGTGTPVDWTDRLLLSTASQLSENASVYRIRDVDQDRDVSPSGTYTETRFVTLPEGLDGDYYVYAVTNADDGIYEHRDSGPDTVRTSDAVTIRPKPKSAQENVALNNLSVGTSDPTSGKPLDLAWDVSNDRSKSTESTYWNYDVYLSTDDTRGDDRLLETFARNEGLEGGQTIRERRTVTLPNGIQGSRHVFVELNLEDASPDDNTAGTASAIDVGLSPPRNLSFTSGPTVQTANVRSGQSVTVTWTIENDGKGGVSGAWRDALYLSSDDQVHPGDTQIDYIDQSGPLSAGASYQAQAEGRIPADLTTGTYFLIAQTDQENDIYEHNGEQDNAASTSVSVTLPPPVDLVASNVQAPSQAQSSSTIDVSYDLENKSSSSAEGELFDAVYFSSDKTLDANDTFVGLHAHTVNISATSSQQVQYALNLSTPVDSSAGAVAMKSAGAETFRGEVPGLKPGDYHVIVKPNVRRTLREKSYDDPAVAGTATSVSIPDLSIGASKTLTMGDGERRFFAFDASAGDDLQLTLDADAGAMNLFVSRGEVPSRSFHDFRFEGVASDSVSLTLSSTKADTYYVLAYAEPGAGSRTATLSTQELKFDVRSTHVTRIGDFGGVNLNIQGAQFTPDTDVRLKKGSRTIDAQLVHFISSTTLSARFMLGEATRARVPAPQTEGLDFKEESSLDPVEHGNWDLVASGAEVGSVTRQEAINVEGRDPYEVDVTVDVPPSILVNRKTPATLRVHNPTNRNIPRGLIVLTMPPSVEISAESEAKILFGDDVPSGKPEGPVTPINDGRRIVPLVFYDIPPGETSTVPLKLKPTAQGDISFQARTLLLNHYRFTRFLAWLIYRMDTELSSGGSSLSGGASLASGEPSKASAAGCGEEDLIKDLKRRDENLEETIDHVILEQIQDRAPGAVQNGVNTGADELLAAAGAGAISLLKYPYKFWTLSGWIDETWERAQKWMQRGGNGRGGSGDCRCPPGQNCDPGDGDDDDDDSDDDDDGQDAGGTESRGAIDPNDILGPDGFGSENWIAADERLGYTVRFENDPERATAPARTVTIHQPLDEDFDAGSFRLGPISFGSFTFTAPQGKSFYSDRLDLRDSLGVFVEVTAGLDVTNRELFWTFRSIDPKTGQTPTSPLLGFLPVNDSTGRGEGSVQYSIRPKSEASTGTRLDAQAEIVFDRNAPIDTPPIFNTVEAGKPSSQLAPLSVNRNADEIILRWSGQDAAGGTGVESYSIYSAKGEGSFSRFKSGITDTSFVFSADRGYKYRFFVRAEDRAGNKEPLKNQAEAQTILGEAVQVYPGDTNRDGVVDQGDVLPIGRYFGVRGPDRPSVSSFTSVPVVSWSQKPATFADANGDGTIDQGDVLPIGRFFGLSPSKRGTPRNGATQEPLASLHVRPLPEGTTVPVYVRVGTEERPAQDVLGVSAGLRVSPETFSVQSIEPTDALGPDLLSFQRHEEKTGAVGVGYTRRNTSGPAAPMAGDKVVKIILEIAAPMDGYAEIQLQEGTTTTPNGSASARSRGEARRVRLTSPKSTEVPGRYTLKQNYPNPAARQTTIRFALPETQSVTLEVYDILGRRVATLKQKKEMETGWHAVQVDASRMASGTYFYRLRAGDFRATKKMVVVR